MTAADYQAILAQATAQTAKVLGVTEQARMRGITAGAEK